MNPIAEELNDAIAAESPSVLEMLSDLGKQLYYPRGILSQSAEAKAKATRFNATIGIAMEDGEGMHLPCMRKYFNELGVDEIFTYAPSYGLPALREAWQAKIKEDTPTVGEAAISMPVVTNALTHGLSVCADLFINPGDLVVLPDKIWGNYNLIFKVRKKAEFLQFPFFDGPGMNLSGFKKTLTEAAGKREKIVVLLNFPNNPTGYTVTKSEAEQIVEIISEVAAGGTKLVVLLDDAYYGLFYGDDTNTESLFGPLSSLSENVLAVKVDGATKEYYVWGFRIGFLTYGIKGGTADGVYGALEKKTGGDIRGNISNCCKLSQNLVIHLLKDPALAEEKQAKFEIMKARALKVKEALANEKYADVWEPYPFNSGYFMCLRLKEADAEKMRVHLLDKYQTGTIATGPSDLRVAFSCTEVDQIEEIFETLYKAAKEVV